MRRNVVLSVLVGALFLALPLAAGALGLDIEAKVGGGLAAGTTSNPNQTGSPRAGFEAGLDFDVFLLSAGPVDLGLSLGGQFSYLTFHGVLNVPAAPPFIPVAFTLTSDSNYKYINIPISIVGRLPIDDSLRLTFRAGGFIGYFLGGASDNSYSPPIQPNGTVTLDSSTTVQWEYGIHVTGGVDIALVGGLALSPSVVFDMGLTNTTNTPGYAYSDTFWSLTAMIGIKYTVF
ncbi:MAG TPA: outer membrane beta-barrel protein [Spirochaetia bacterium]|nr:outer membrane beta-barrel protein [Spirochaetia bacterium]